MVNELLTYITTVKKQTQSELDIFLAKWETYIQNTSPSLIGLSPMLKNDISGGKMIRGMLVKLGYDLGNKKNNSDIYKISAAFELLHTALLIHDDVIDKSPMRRGKLTIYKSLGENHHAISQAICIGDIGFFLATKLITESNFPDKQKTTILQNFSQMLLDTILGEMIDVELSFNKTSDEAQIITMQKLKTAYYTIVWPLTIGAILGGITNKKRLTTIKLFGEQLGIAFQIRDDILGVFGDKKTLGKSTASDIKEGKTTLLFRYAQKHGTIKQRSFLMEYYGTEVTPEVHAKIKDLFNESGSLTYSQQLAKEYIEKSKLLIPSITNDKQMQNYFYQLAELVVERGN